VRITVQLIDVSDGAHIWSETYDRTMTDIFAVQDDVAAAIIDALQIHVSVNPTRGRPTENTEAYALFLKARPQLYVFEARDAGEILLEAIELDPGFAEAYELLAYSYWLQAGTGIPAAEGQKLMGEAAGKALAIDSDLLFAQALFASANIENYSYLREIEAFERTVREAQTNSLARDALITDLTEAGYLREAVGLAEQWVDLDRLSPLANFRLFETLYSVGRTGEAVAALELAHQLGAGSQYWYLGYVNLVEGQDEAAIANIETVWPKDINLPRVRDFVTAGRDPATGQAYLDLHIPQIVAFAPEEDRRAWQLGTTRWYLFLGFLDRYFELILDLDLDVAGYEWTDADELVRDGTIWRRLGFTAHPKYLEVAESIGIVDLWEQRGQPDFCSKSSGQWVCE